MCLLLSKRVSGLTDFGLCMIQHINVECVLFCLERNVCLWKVIVSSSSLFVKVASRVDVLSAKIRAETIHALVTQPESQP